MSKLYRHFAPSNTSLSDDYDDEEPVKSNFFNGDQPLFNDAAIQPHWSSSQHTTDPLTAASRLAQESPVSTIPPEILIYILKHLHHPRDLVNSLKVSRTWCECAVELLWHKPAFTSKLPVGKMVNVLKMPQQTFQYSKFIRRLNFLTMGQDLNDETFLAFAGCDRLERLTLNGCKSLSSTALEKSLIQFPNLVAVDLTGVKDTTNEAITTFATVAKRLQGINLQGCKLVGDSALVALARNCPLLRRVKLSGLELVTDLGVSAIVQGCPLLLEIDLHQCDLITDISVRDIWTHSVQMRELRLAQCTKLTDLAFPTPPRLDLNGDAAPSTNPFPMRDPADLSPLVINRVCEQLRMLDLTACGNITDDAVEGIISHAPKIRNLVLSKCVLLTDRSVESICSLGRNLHYLHLGHASKITDKSVKTLARACNRIRYVDFANCTNLTDMSVFELSALPKLRRIGLVRVANLTDEAIYALAERHATLERIHLSYCDQISVMAVHFLLLKLHKLTHLSLTGVPAFRQAELQRFCREAPKDFSNAQRQSFCVFSGKGISNLRAYLTELFDRITEANVTDDTEYENEDDDTVAFQENETPEPEAAPVADDHPPNEPVHTPLPAQMPMIPNVGFRRNPRIYDLALQRDRAHRANPGQGWFPPNHHPPIRGTSANRLEADNAIHGATSVLNQHLQAARDISDVLPIVEPHSPVDQQGRPSQPFNNTGDWFQAPPANYIPTMHPNAFRAEFVHGASGSGTRTPDLNFAEIGHGRGAQGSNAPDAAPAFSGVTPRVPYMEVDVPTVTPAHVRSTNTRAMSDPGNLAAMAYNIGDAAMLPQDGGLQSQPGFSARVREARAARRRDTGNTANASGGEASGHASRGRFRSRIRNGLSTAENYLFGRHPPPPPGLGGSPPPNQPQP